MKAISKILTTIALVQLLAIPSLALAAEEVPTEQEISKAEGEPPVIPHKVAEGATTEQCLGCHLKGKKGAPPTSHPKRAGCTQCHVPADGFTAAKASKGK